VTGDQRIDGLLSLGAWGGSSIEYSFPTTNSIYGYAELTDLPAGFFALNAQQQNAALFALDADSGVNVAAKAGFSVEGFTNLTVNFDSTADTEQIRLANTTSSQLGTARVADFPVNAVTAQTQDNGDVWFGTAYQGTIYDFATPVAGNYAWDGHIHEIGHALGLKHGHETDWGGGALPSNVDSIEYSIMTYRNFIGDDAAGAKYEQWGAPQTFMMLDIAALQRMYGADYTTNSGDTVYSWNPASGNTVVNGGIAIQPGGNRIFATIWDGGGIDTYDLSHYATSLTVDLTPGGYSTFSSAQIANLDVVTGGSHFARGNIFNALLFNGDTRSLIENVIGGAGDDFINGNQANNNLRGTGGADTLIGNDGNDTLDGGARADTTSGGNGNDTVLDSDGVDFDNHSGGAATDTISYAGITLTGVTINLATGLVTDAVGNSETIAGFETVRGSQGNDTVIGSAGANIVDGQGGNDFVYGGGGNDTGVVGGAGNDSLFGEAGNDTLRGGAGRDILVGGAGNDRFDFDLISDSRVGNAVCDVLQAGGGGNAFDLPGANSPASAGDRIDLSTIDANVNMGGNQTFIFGGTGAGHVRCINSGTTTHVLAYVNGDSVADFQLNIVDGAVRAAAYQGVDFVL
jgi:serralysin